MSCANEIYEACILRSGKNPLGEKVILSFQKNESKNQLIYAEPVFDKCKSKLTILTLFATLDLDGTTIKKAKFKIFLEEISIDFYLSDFEWDPGTGSDDFDYKFKFTTSVEEGSKELITTDIPQFQQGDKIVIDLNDISLYPRICTLNVV